MKPRPHPIKNSQDHLLTQIAKTLRGHRTYLVASHVRPDGDAVGASLAMGMLLKKLGKQVTVWNDDGLPLKYAFLRNSKLLQRTPNEKAVTRPFDVIVALDTANFARLGRASKSTLPAVTNRASKGPPTKAPILINIDHHESNERYGNISWIEPHHAATSQLLFDLFRSQKFPITPEIASCLFVGIQTDTGSFRYGNATSSVFRAAADLIECGADVGEIGRQVYDTFPLARLRLLQLVLQNMRLSADGRIVYFWLTKKMYERSGAAREDTEDLINYARSVDSAIVAILFEEIADRGRIRISLRSKSPKINVSQITRKFGGGGHAGAAGATPKGKPLEIERKVLAEVRRALRKLS